MARYDYRCGSCGKVFEVEHGMTEHPDIVCPECGGATERVVGVADATERVFNASGIKFEGSGFYNTDQRGGSSSTSATSGASSETHSCACADCPHNN